MVDLVGDVRVQVPERIVGQRREVNDRVEALQASCLDVSQVESSLGDIVNPRCERTLPEEVAVETGHLVAGIEQHGHRHGTDIALVAGD